MPIASINPTTGETLESFSADTDAEIERKLVRADAAFRTWRRRPVAERAAVVARAGEILEAEKEQFGRTMTLEMGKTLKAAIEEAAKCASACRYYAEHAERFLAPEVVRDDSEGRDYVAFQPLGAVLAVMPWNFPFWQVIRFAAPALCAGNVGLLKHASNVPRSAMALEDLFRRAGAPEGVFQTLLIGSDAVQRVLEDARVAAATLTGSEPAGSSVAATAGKHIKKTVLELGGSDPFIVLPSADLAAAAETGVRARMINNGQSCIAAKRFIVHEAVADEFERRFVDRVRALRVGDPLHAETDVGPLATPQIVEDTERQVRDSVARGARLVVGGARIDGPGNFFAPAVLADIPKDAPAYREEVFGPVALLFRVPTIDAAIALANDSDFGLGASAWTTDDAEARRLADEIESGSVFINAMVASDPRFPFGGVKHSGYGRELSAYGLREFVNVKTVRWTRKAAASGANTE
ncbi:MAG TPA: NAD-dependent succinate-semialdehyde dehydrogenase [Gemmatimonadaceae bacterium]|nr:NAD-dependent succinate-semialdehyde dehydrogenase [Gemmatimonadaceae bacterium]